MIPQLTPNNQIGEEEGMRKAEKQMVFDIIAEKNAVIGGLKKELLEVYKYLYPMFEDVIKQCKEASNIDPIKLNFLVDSAALDIMRAYHKEQLEKEKI